MISGSSSAWRWSCPSGAPLLVGLAFAKWLHFSADHQIWQSRQGLTDRHVIGFYDEITAWLRAVGSRQPLPFGASIMMIRAC